MSIDEFNNLPIDKQVEYINKELEGSSLNKICKSLGISESTVRDRFKRNNYKRVDKKFVVTTTDTTINTYKGNEVVRSFRVNEEVQQRFKVYCKANSDHKVSDILSTALEEFLNNREY